MVNEVQEIVQSFTLFMSRSSKQIKALCIGYLARALLSGDPKKVGRKWEDDLHSTALSSVAKSQSTIQGKLL